jgi:hypothetical protein
MPSVETLEKRSVEVEEIKGQRTGLVCFVGSSNEYLYAFYLLY